jgi:Cu(I)/Ag(I) efflux system membrane fusion protein
MNSILKNISGAFLLTFFFLSFSSTLTAQSVVKKGMEKTISFKVTGICNDCKHRIESTALDVKGVKKAEWDIQTDMLVCVGSPKMDKQKIADALAKAGHKSEFAAADPKGYAKLPGCCQYDSGIEKH